MLAVRRAAMASVAAVLGAAGAMGGGCTVGYVVDVRNQTAQPVTAEVMRMDTSGQNMLLARTRIDPGGREATGRYNVPDSARVYVEVDVLGNPGAPARMTLLPGKTIVNVNQNPPGPTGKLTIEEVR